MKINQIYCPSCGGSIKGDLSKDIVVCPFCGTQLAIDHEKNEITINQNISITKNQTNRIINDADIIKANAEKTKIKTNFILDIFEWLVLIFFFLIFLGIIFYIGKR